MIWSEAQVFFNRSYTVVRTRICVAMLQMHTSQQHLQTYTLGYHSLDSLKIHICAYEIHTYVYTWYTYTLLPSCHAPALRHWSNFNGGVHIHNRQPVEKLTPDRPCVTTIIICPAMMAERKGGGRVNPLECLPDPELKEIIKWPYPLTLGSQINTDQQQTLPVSGG